MSDDSTLIYDDQLFAVHTTAYLAGDWWQYAGFALAALQKRTYRYGAAKGQTGVVITIGEPHDPIIILRIASEEGKTILDAATNPAYELEMMELVGFIESASIHAESLRRKLVPTADEVIERYYRSRSQGSRKTLREVAEGTGYSYDYLRKVKRAYDAAGKWGSKKEPIGSPV